jgi:hypothetical protein
MEKYTRRDILKKGLKGAVAISTLPLLGLEACTRVDTLNFSEKNQRFNPLNYNLDTIKINENLYSFKEIPNGYTADFGNGPYPRNKLPGYMLIPLEDQTHKISRGHLLSQVKVDSENTYILAPVVKQETGLVRLVQANEQIKPSEMEIVINSDLRKAMAINGKEVEISAPYKIEKINLQGPGGKFAQLETNDRIAGNLNRLQVIYIRQIESPETELEIGKTRNQYFVESRKDFIRGIQLVPIQGKIVKIPKPIQPKLPEATAITN